LSTAFICVVIQVKYLELFLKNELMGKYVYGMIVF